MNRAQALLVSLVLAVVFNMMAGILTLAFVNGTTIVETNPYSSVLLQEIGSAALLVHALEIATIYPLAFLLSRAVSSDRPLFRVKRIYLFTFSLLIGVLPAGAFVDFLSDVLVLVSKTDALVGPEKIVAVALAIAVPFASIQVQRRWTLPKASDCPYCVSNPVAS